MSSLSLFQTESAPVGELWQLTKAEKASGLSVTQPVISNGGAGPHSEAGMAGPPHGIVLFPPRPYHSPQVAANLLQLHPHSEAQYLQQIRPRGTQTTPLHHCHRGRAKRLCLMEEQVRAGEYEMSDKNNYSYRVGWKRNTIDN